LATLGVDINGIIKAYTSRRIYRAPVNSFDGVMYDALKPYLNKANRRVAREVERAIKDKRITKKFCDTSKLYEQVERFTDPKSFTRSMQGNVNFEAAKLILRSMLPKPCGQLTPLEITAETDISTIFSNPDASSGILAYPLHKDKAADLIKEVALHIMEDYDQTFSLPAIALTRSQITDYIVDGKIDSSHIKYKTRLVMCVDAASVLVEQRLGQPILDCVMKGMNQYAGGVDDHANQRFLLDYCYGKNWVSLDYSKFDATIQGWLIKDVFNLLSEYYPESEKKAFDWISNNFINMQLLMPDGRMYNLHKGIKSGSYFTQMVGSLCNMLMILTYLCAKYGHPDGNQKCVDFKPVIAQLKSRRGDTPLWYTMMVMGDDNILFTYDELDMADLSAYLKHNFYANITVDGEKAFSRGTAYDAPDFLKRVWTNEGQMRDELEMWVNLLHPERERDYDGYSPYHILYGYFLTFRVSVRNYMNEYELIEGMHRSAGGLDALARIKLNDLPGSLRSQVMNRGIDRDNLVEELKMRRKLVKAS
jgi:hypothetical protein